MMFCRRRRRGGPIGQRAYVVGDVHGRIDLLEQLLSLIETDVRHRPKSKNSVVFLGDLIDRGPASEQVVERLRSYKPDFARMIFLMGNHEEVMLRVLGGEVQLLQNWLQFGGAECVRSYGIESRKLRQASPEQALQMLKGAIPHTHIEFISNFADTVSFGDYLFVHAGIRPTVALADQRSSDLRWIREPFLEDVSDHGFTVVHGHTVTEDIEVRSNRIGVDTGAYKTGVLTALGIEGEDRWLLQTAAAEAT